MDKRTYRIILYAVGTLPFWTGKKKLIRFLAGEAGSYWEGKTPLKRIYLDQPFFGELSEYSSSEVRQTVQKLLNAGYLDHETMTGNKPYRVVKFSGKGVKKYYNSLVRQENLEEPYWWLHHVSRLETPTNTGINTGGEILPYNEELYLTQTPAYRTDQQRLQSSKTVQVHVTEGLDLTPGHYTLEQVKVSVEAAPTLVVSSKEQVEKINPGDLGRKLGHFQAREAQTRPPDPFVIRGELVEASEPDRDARRKIRLRNNEDKTLTILIKTNQIPNELELKEGTRYVLGPVTESVEDGESSKKPADLALEQSGEIRVYRP